MKIILSALLVAWSFLIHAEEAIHVTADKSLPQFRVKLPANPTTGYQWRVLNYDKQLFALANQTYVAPKTNRMGAGGITVFTFMLRPGHDYPQNTNMVFKYARSWEAKSGIIKKIIVHFKKSDKNAESSTE